VSLDPIAVAVLQNRLRAAVEEMGEAMLRTAYSQILNSSRDFSIAITDAEARLVAQADHIPVHVGAMPFAARAVIDAFPSMQDGDLHILNDPYHGGSHLPDLTAVVPVFAEGAPRYFTVVRAHVSDIGGATHGGYNPGATEIFQEGLRLPPILLGQGGTLRGDLVRMLATNTRLPRDFSGDLAAMFGAAQLGALRVRAMLEARGLAAMQAGVATILDGAEAHARRTVAAWQDGVFHGEAVLDDDGHGIENISIRATVTKRGETLHVDLSASDDQPIGFVNSSYPNMRSAVAMAFAFLLDPETEKNDGAFRPLSVTAREGSVVWAREGAPVTLCTSHCSNEIVEAIMVAMAQSCPERTMGGWGRRFRVALDGTNPRTGKRFMWHLFHARPGGGASVNGPGWPGAGEWHSAGGIKFGSIEVAESRFPLHFLRHEFREASGGAGRHAGGDGAELDLVIESDGPVRANTAGDGVRHGSRGIAGGQDGVPHAYDILRADGTTRPLATKEVGVILNPGDVLRVKSSGGGGWGSAA
jgi:N-methylhydantoinase B